MDNKSALVLVITWHGTDSKPFSENMAIMTLICFRHYTQSYIERWSKEYNENCVTSTNGIKHTPCSIVSRRNFIQLLRRLFWWWWWYDDGDSCFHYSGDTLGRPKWPTTQLFVQHFQVNDNENIRALHYWPFVGEATSKKNSDAKAFPCHGLTTSGVHSMLQNYTANDK